MPISTIFTALFYPYIAQEQTAQSASLFVSRSAIAPKIKVRSIAIERFQRAMCSALIFFLSITVVCFVFLGLLLSSHGQTFDLLHFVYTFQNF